MNGRAEVLYWAQNPSIEGEASARDSRGNSHRTRRYRSQGSKAQLRKTLPIGSRAQEALLAEVLPCRRP